MATAVPVHNVTGVKPAYNMNVLHFFYHQSSCLLSKYNLP